MVPGSWAVTVAWEGQAFKIPGDAGSADVSPVGTYQYASSLIKKPKATGESHLNTFYLT